MADHKNHTNEGKKSPVIPCWICCPIKVLNQAEADYEEFGIDTKIGEHPDCRKRWNNDTEWAP